MKKFLFLSIVFGIILCFGGVTFADTITDVVEWDVDYFVDSDDNTYNSPYYRGYDEDWGWTHNAISGTISSAELFIAAWDVDVPSHTPSLYDDERDEIYAYDNGTAVFLGTLEGNNDEWGYTTFTLGSNFYDDIANGLEVWMDIDVGLDGWLVTLSKSALSIDNGAVPNPNPNPVPEPATMLLLGTGLVGFVAFGRKKFLKK